MAYSQPIADMLRELFAVSGINAAFEEKPGCGIFTIRMKLRCRLQTAQMLVLVREDNFSTLTTIPLAADENNRLAVAEYLTRVNFNMRNGNFELNMERSASKPMFTSAQASRISARRVWPSCCPS